MKEWTEIRRKVLVEKVPIRQICHDYDISHHTVQKMIELSEPPGYQCSVERPRPKLGPFLGVIDQILADDRDAPVKQRHSAKRIFERLRDEHDDDGSESHVRRYVAEVAIATARSSCPSPNHRARRSSTSARRSWRSPECG